MAVGTPRHIPRREEQTTSCSSFSSCQEFISSSWKKFQSKGWWVFFFLGDAHINPLCFSSQFSLQSFFLAIEKPRSLKRRKRRHGRGREEKGEEKEEEQEEEKKKKTTTKEEQQQQQQHMWEQALSIIVCFQI